MIDLFLSPMGRLAGGPPPRGRFWLVVLVLLAGTIAARWLVTFGPATLMTAAGLIGLALLYPWGCLFAKRLRDAGKSSWLAVAIVGAFLAVELIALLVVAPMVEARLSLVELARDARAAEARIFIPLTVFSTALALGAAFFVARLPSASDDNRTGGRTDDAATAKV